MPKNKFIYVWNTSKTLAEAAQRLGVKKTSATSRAVHFRSQGAKLKKFPVGTPKGAKATMSAMTAPEVCLSAEQHLASARQHLLQAAAALRDQAAKL